MSMRRKRHLWVGLFACIAPLLPIPKTASASRQPIQREIPPSFQEYAVEVASIRNPRLDLKSHRIGSTFPTVLRRGVRHNRVNFAGSFSLVEWGCGSDCRWFAIVDLRNGHIYHDSSFVLLRGAQYRADSALFVANPRYPDAGNFLADVPTSYWVWQNRALLCLYPSSVCKAK
jgi:hypothetical protein